jgi:predicted component of type VI protein secretion system
LEHTELKTWLHSVHPDNVSLFLDFWGIAKEVFTLQQSNFMLALLPHLHRIVGDWVLTTACLQIMLQEQVQLESFIAGKKAETEDLFSRLGGISLGVDAVLGDTWIDDQPAIKVKVGPVAMDRLMPFLPGGIRHQQLEIWYGYFFPAETEVSTELWIEADQASFRLLPEESFSRLGLTTII